MPRTTRQIGEVSANPEAFNLVRATLTHHDEFDVDIKGLIQKIDIIEDINKPFLEVIVFIKDSTNFLELHTLMVMKICLLKYKEKPVEK